MDTSKIIRGVVSNGRYTVTAPIVKENYGIYLQIEGVELPETYQVDFSNEEHHGTSVTMIGNAGGVRIPRQFIDTGKDIFAFLYWVGADYGKTVYKFRIPNKLRPDRTDEEPTPEEQSTIDQAISALNEAVEQTAQDVASADASAQSASEFAEDARDAEARAAARAATAKNHADRAEQARDDAQTYTNNASASATASAQSASQAEQIKSDVEDMVDDAQASASASAQSASASANSASQAQGFAQSASASAQSASTSASNASTSAQTASTKATEASTSASTASQKATESAQSATNASQSAQTAEQAKTASQTAQGLAESARDSAVSAKTDAESARDEAQNLVDGISGKVEQIDSNTERIESLEDDRYKPYVVDSASGSIASFVDGADDLPLKSLVVDINPVQDLSHGDPSPENICPISGWTQVSVEQNGKNFLALPIEFRANLNVPQLFFIKKGSYKLRFSGMTNATSWRTGVWMKDANGNDLSDITHKPYAYYSWYASAGYWMDGENGARNEFNITIAEDCYIRFFFALGDTSASTVCNDAQLELGSTATPYEPYTGRSITINLGQTVYGGKLDVLSGELVIDRAMVDLGTLTWRYSASGNPFFYAPVFDIKHPIDWNAIPNWICSMYKTVSGNNASGGVTGIGGNPNNSQVRACDLAYTDVASFISAVTGQTLVYELATPLEIQLTPNEVNSLFGVNNIWADSGDTEAVYRADTKLFIERLTAPDSADMIADANITSGQYFMVGNSLYKATANIANGAQIVVGTNCIRKSLSEALNEINA